MKLITLLLALFPLFFSLHAQVLINEYSCSNWKLTTDNYDSYEDWIELYNISTTPVNIGNYCLSDKVSQPTKWRFPANTIINGNSRLLVWASGRNVSSGTNHHTNFVLTQTKLPTEYIVFADANGDIIDQKAIEVTQMHHSHGRNPDGGQVWSVYLTPTPSVSNNPSSAKQRYASTPVFSQSSGFYSTQLNISIQTTEPGATIYYTTDGSHPTTASAIYTIPLNIDSTTVLKAIAVSSSNSIATSLVCFATYFINEIHTLPVVSISADELQTLADGDNSLRPHGTIEYFNMSHHRTTAGYGEFNSHGQDSWALDQRSLDYIMRDEFGYNYALQEQLFGTLTPRAEFQRIILRASGDDNYPANHRPDNQGSAHLRDAYLQNLAKTGGLNLDVRTATKTIVYLNGIYWGVYDIREIPDEHDFTKYYYNQDRFHLQYIETWGGTWAEYGGPQALADWNQLHTWVMTHDMTIPAVWDTVTSKIDVYSLVDYVIVNSVSVCSDWLNYNTGWWRGLDSAGTHKKWGWILWDNDAIFGHYRNYTQIPDKGPLARPCNVESGVLSDPEDHIDLLNKLRQNQDFNYYYISRYIDLSNTVFSCDYMLNTLDSLVDVIDPEMDRHSQRWSGTYAEWKANTQELREYVEQRCNAMDSLLNECYSLNGPYSLHIDALPIGTGKVKVNSLTISDFPWSGNFHGGIPVKILAIPDTLNGFSFDRWETVNHPALPSMFIKNALLHLNTDDSLIAYFKQQPVNIGEVPSGLNAVAYPTVFSTETRIEFIQSDNYPVNIVLYSLTGTSVYRIVGENTAGLNSFTLRLSDTGLSSGIYLLNLRSSSGSKTLKLVYTGGK